MEFSMGRKKYEGGIQNSKKTFGGDRIIHYLVCGHGFTDVYIHQNA